MPSSIIRFLNQVSAQPDHPAVVENGRAVTYGELGLLCRRLAKEISTIGDQPRVAISLAPGAEAYASFLATHMAGGYCAPISPTAPAAQRTAVLREFAPDVVIGPAEIQADLSPLETTPRWLDPRAEMAETLDRPQPAHRLAFVMFSASEGRPDGIMISREALDNYVGCILRESAITPEDRWSQGEDIATDLSVVDIFGGLCGGATLFPLAPGPELTAKIKTLGLTVWNSSAKTIDRMIASGQLPTENIASLRLMILCDQVIRPELVSYIFEAHPKITLLRTYGVTGAAASCTLLRLHNDNYSIACRATVAIGEPVDNMRVHLVGGESPEEGELAFTGPQVPDGYWNDPEATRRSLRPLQEGGPLAYFTKQWAERSGGHIYVRSGQGGPAGR